MAEVPETNSHLMSNYSDNDEEFYPDNPYKMKSSSEDINWDFSSNNSSTSNAGITLEITEQRESTFSFRKTVVLVVATERLKSGTRRGSLFSDMDLLDLLRSIFVEEEISFSDSQSTFASDPSYRYFTSKNYKIKDASSKSLVLDEFSGNAKLVAMHLQGMHSAREEKIKMEFYSTTAFNRTKKQHVALSLLGRNLYLSCSSVGGTPELHLKKVSNLQDISNDLIFLRSENGPGQSSKISFESAAFPGWYISTSKDENEPIKMSHQTEQRCINDFSLFESK